MNTITEEVQFDQIEYVKQLEEQNKALIERNEFLEMANLSQEKHIKDVNAIISALKQNKEADNREILLLKSDNLTLESKLSSIKGLIQVYKQEGFFGKIRSAGAYLRLISDFAKDAE